MSQTTDPSASTQVPRPLTAAARRQSWRELPVRVWSLVTLGVLIVILAVSVRGVLQGRADRKLLREGIRVDATIDAISGGTRNQGRSVARQVDLSFQLPGEAERRELNKVMLAPSASGGAISKGDKLPILVNPRDVRVWTDRVEPPSWIFVLAAPLLLLPLAAVLALITWLSRSRTARLYQNGILRHASVVEAHRSALIPGQKALKLSIAGKVLSAAYPDALGPVARGDGVEVMVDRETKPTRAIVARAYASGPLAPVRGGEG